MSALNLCAEAHGRNRESRSHQGHDANVSLILVSN